MLTTILSHIADKYNLRRLPGRYAGPCPKCGGSANSDKFTIKDDGGYKCYSCTDMHGDIITWMMDMEGKTCPEAYEAAGRECVRTSCPVRENCRMGEGKGRRTAPERTRRAVEPLSVSSPAVLPTPEEKNPEQIWKDLASVLVTAARGALVSQPAVLTWLAARGIDQEAAARFHLGWLDHDRKIDRAAVGLGPRADGKTTLWIPGGLLIPIFNEQGGIHRIRVRRTKQARGRFLPDLKYVWIEGSGNNPLVIRPRTPSRGTLVVESELDAYACAAAHDQVTVISLGTVSAGLPAPLRLEQESAPVILVALDADPDKNGKKGAGPAAIGAWTELYRQARFYPLPNEKDPGEYVQNGGTLRTWIESGLLPELPVPASKTAAHDLRLFPERPQRGAGGEAAQVEEGYFSFQPAGCLGADGEELVCYVTDHEPTWHRLTMKGKIVFSRNELERLKVACSGMDAAETAAAARMAVMLKETFTASYIRDGRVG